MAKLPSFQFYPGDWMKDPALRACSAAARGLWMDVLCLMFESDRRGFLQAPSGKPYSHEQLARMTGCLPDEVSRLLAELESSGVFSRTKNGTIFSRRLKRDEESRADHRKRQNDYRNSLKPHENGDAGVTPDVTVLSHHSSSSSSSSSSNKQHRAKPAVVRFSPPLWVDLATWQDFEAHRGKLRKPMTDRARRDIIAKLETLRARGQDPEAMLAQSIRKGWQDVFEVKEDFSATPKPPVPRPKTQYELNTEMQLEERRQAKLAAGVQ